MPATYAPSETDQERRHREDGDSGGGRRPPTDKRTGGGGDPEYGNNRRRLRPSPRERLNRFRMGLFFGLSAVAMFFVAIVSVFFVSQGSGHIDANARFINEWLPLAVPPILWLNTAVLLVSSVSIEVARRQMFREMDAMDEWLGFGKPVTRRAMPWLVITVIFGTMFLVGQVVAWKQLAASRVFFNTSPSSHSFFLITGVHGAHLVVGVVALVGALVGLYWSKSLENRQILVDLAAWYWHTMGVLWLLLFGLLAFCQ